MILTIEQARSVLCRCKRWTHQNAEFECLDVCYTFRGLIVAEGYYCDEWTRLTFLKNKQTFTIDNGVSVLLEVGQ